MTRNDGGIDLSPLDPEQDPERLERVVSGVLERLGPGIVEDAPTIEQQVTRTYALWFRPVFAAASVVAIAAGLVLAGRGVPDAVVAETAPEPTLIPATWTAWMVTGTPTVEELLFSLAGENR